MSDQSTGAQYLLSVPPAMAAHFGCAVAGLENSFAACDPEGAYLGSGGATAYLLAEAWAASGGNHSFIEWLRGSRKVVLHGGGQSRRLPAYAPFGKPFLPLPIIRSSYGQSIDQNLIDAQIHMLRQLYADAPAEYVLAIASGDVLLRFAPLKCALPEGDVLIFGMRAEAEIAKDHGVVFSDEGTSEVAFFLQKPSAPEISTLAAGHSFLVDTGVWLLSERAVMLLMARSGWLPEKERFHEGSARHYELYAGFGTGLGARPRNADPEIAALRSHGFALDQPHFYHLGTSRQLIESLTAMQNMHRNRNGLQQARIHPDRFILNARLEADIADSEHHTIWVENSSIPPSWCLSHSHILTGIPENGWELALEPEVCLDMVPVGESEYCLRSYGLDDRFSGPIGAEATRWFGRSAACWLERRNLSWAAAGIDPACDIQQAALFPTAALESLTSEFLQWMLASTPEKDSTASERWRHLPRQSAADLARTANLARLQAQRRRNQRHALEAMFHNRGSSPFFRIDLGSAARLLADPPGENAARERGGGAHAIPSISDGSTISFTAGEPARRPTLDYDAAPGLSPVERAKAAMFTALVRKEGGDTEWRETEARAFRWLASSLVDPEALAVSPARELLDDQIVWARSPVRLDLAGGWTDTPPYCLEHGGRVVNMAVNLNGQPPVQVFVKPCERAELVIRSIDLGVEERIQSFDQMEAYALPGSEFALARAAFALAGFAPRFHAGPRSATLQAQLEALGGGFEVTLLAAAPKGSGLGTSSILAATLLAALSDACCLGWDSQDLISRALVLEQLLTTGGGWQDQAGAVFRGVKLLTTAPGLEQDVSARWLPEHLFSPEEAGRCMLLYYTGLTRLAKNLLQEIVRGMFVNRGAVLDAVGAIGQNADEAYRAIQSGSYEALCGSVARSWALNRQLDSGTRPPAVEALMDQVSDYVAGAKLLGAGGGGYCLFLAKDESAAMRLRQTLLDGPPNPRARFVNFAISRTGLQVTRS